MNNSSASRLFFVETRASLYGQQADSEADTIIDQHNLAMLCFDVADLIVQGHDLYDSINRLDSDWRMLVLRGNISYNAEIEKRIERLYRSWLNATERTFVLFEKIRSDYLARGFDNAPVERLAVALREVKGGATADNEFFTHKSLTMLRDDAIDAFRSGNAEMV